MFLVVLLVAVIGACPVLAADNEIHSVRQVSRLEFGVKLYSHLSSLEPSFRSNPAHTELPTSLVAPQPEPLEEAVRLAALTGIASVGSKNGEGFNRYLQKLVFPNPEALSNSHATTKYSYTSLFLASELSAKLLHDFANSNAGRRFKLAAQVSAALHGTDIQQLFDGIHWNDQPLAIKQAVPLPLEQARPDYFIYNHTFLQMPAIKALDIRRVWETLSPDGKDPTVRILVPQPELRNASGPLRYDNDGWIQAGKGNPVNELKEALASSLREIANWRGFLEIAATIRGYAPNFGFHLDGSPTMRLVANLLDAPRGTLAERDGSVLQTPYGAGLVLSGVPIAKLKGQPATLHSGPVYHGQSLALVVDFN